jgi:2-polyprenyl-3-methyl-5-hydroxy-6-metoxy-1,4-benzoquinol methylase
MEHLVILEKIIDNISDSLEPGTAIYIFSAAIYEAWSSDSSIQLEKNLAKRLVTVWKGELEYQMIEAYRGTKHSEKRLEPDDFYKKWLEGSNNLYKDNEGLRRAVWRLWEDKYGIRYTW